jgi:hypothetical protein
MGRRSGLMLQPVVQPIDGACCAPHDAATIDTLPCTNAACSSPITGVVDPVHRNDVASAPPRRRRGPPSQYNAGFHAFDPSFGLPRCLYSP